MGRRGGFPGGGGNMKNLMKQVQKMQVDMEKMQEELKEKEIEASSGGGVVTARVNGEKEIVSIKIEEDIVDPEDVEMLEDLIMAAINEALRQVDSETEKEMSKLTGGMNLPGF